jgi:hypothetical protein
VIKEISLSEANSRELIPKICLSGLPSSFASINIAISDNLKLFAGDTET